MMTTRKNQQNKIRWSKSKSKDQSTIGVYLRLRPLKSDEPTIQKINDQQVKTLPPDGSAPQVYSFTKVFDNAQQSQIFEQVAQPIVEDFIISARDGLIFTYGITGSGKTYTMEGTRNDPGLIFRSIDFLFNSIAAQQTPKSIIEMDGQNSYRLRDQEPLYPNLARSDTPSALPSVIKWRQRSKETAKVDVDHTKYFALFISLVELYNKQVHDLFEDLDPHSSEKKKREIRTDQRGMSYVANVVEVEVKSAEEAVDLYTRGIRRRKIGSTALNQESSRGHCVLNLRLVQIGKSIYDGQFDEDTLVSSQLCLVDLAGSERTKRSGVTGGALHEAGSINNSLGALRKCIRALRDREPTSNIQYREHSLTRLFKSYFEGHGFVRMVLCVKPTIADFYENNTAMEFGILSQDVPVDYAPPPPPKRSKTRAQDTLTADMQEYLDKKSLFKPNPDLTDEEFISDWIDKLKSNRDERKKCFKVALDKQRVFRVNILETIDSNASLKQLYETRAKELKSREEQLELLESKLHTTERSREQKNEKIRQLQRKVGELDARAKQAYAAEHKIEMLQAQNETAHRKLLNLVKSEQNRSENFKEIQRILADMKPRDWVGAAPSAPEMEPLQSSSPIDIPNPSTTETNDSHTVPPISTNSSSDAMEFHHDHRVSSSPIKVMTSPTNGVPVINPRHERSLSCSSMRWIHHKPQGTIDTGTVLRPKFKNGRSVKHLQSSDILRKDAAGYSLVHQDADPNGDVETSVYKGRVVSTVCGGAQVILNDIETMRQVSPKKRRASIAQFNN
uniref:Kinesin-like protein n=1 Tax=Aceria tosichella TaxID=561515 RepID=A0A6G1SCJ4_9ACAR